MLGDDLYICSLLARAIGDNSLLERLASIVERVKQKGRVARLSEKGRHSELSSCLRTIIHHPTSHRLILFYLHFPVHRWCFANS